MPSTYSSSLTLPSGYVPGSTSACMLIAFFESTLIIFPVLLFGTIYTKLDIGTKPFEVVTLKLSILSNVLPSFG